MEIPIAIFVKITFSYGVFSFHFFNVAECEFYHILVLLSKVLPQEILPFCHNINLQRKENGYNCNLVIGIVMQQVVTIMSFFISFEVFPIFFPMSPELGLYNKITGEIRKLGGKYRASKRIWGDKIHFWGGWRIFWGWKGLKNSWNQLVFSERKIRKNETFSFNVIEGFLRKKFFRRGSISRRWWRWSAWQPYL